MPIPILNATINLTQQCNLRCGYCFTYGKTDKVISFETAQKCVNFLIKQAVEADEKDIVNRMRQIDISFWGGEPLLEWELLKEIVLYTEAVLPRGIGVQFGGTTNGTLLTPDKLDFLYRHRIVFVVSLDGTKETHDKYRHGRNNEGSQEIIVENLKEVLKTWPMYVIRTSPYPERIDHFYEDIKYLVDLGVRNIMFSPVYEHEWREEHWNTWEAESKKVVGLMKECIKKNQPVHIEHFWAYCGKDASKWPCGAGRFYVGFDTDGSIWPCHRFCKFGDDRPWQEKEMCIGHVDYGITKPELRNKFIDYTPKCGDCKYLETTPCHGGCYGLKYDILGEIDKPADALCRYVKMQVGVSEHLVKEIGPPMGTGKTGGCVCNYMRYFDDQGREIVNMDGSGVQCHCNNAVYTGDLNTQKVCKPLELVQVNPYDILKRVQELEKEMKDVQKELRMIK